MEITDKMIHDLLTRQQIESMMRCIVDDLEYHFINFRKAQEVYEYEYFGPEQGIGFEEFWHNQTSIRAEIMAYIMHVSRFIRFMRSMHKKGYLKSTELKGLEEFEFLRNKWVVHRSVDYPRGDSVDTQFCYLDTRYTFNDKKEFIIRMYQYHAPAKRTKELNISHEHPRVINFVKATLLRIEKRFKQRNGYYLSP